MEEVRERELDDAPPHLSNNEALAWASGFNTAADRTEPNLAGTGERGQEAFASQCKERCQYAQDVAMPEHSCAVRCMYLDHPSNRAAAALAPRGTREPDFWTVEAEINGEWVGCTRLFMGASDAEAFASNPHSIAGRAPRRLVALYRGRTAPEPQPTVESLWQPISTAPKDRELLLWVPDSEDRMIGWWGNEGWLWKDEDMIEDLIAPTHWMSLPEPPADALTEASEKGGGG
jgi:hypothetical protein